MQNEVYYQANGYLNKKHKWKRWKKIVGSLACVVVFCTVYALILPAITMEGTAYCGVEEHKHDESCETTELVCTIETATPHEHGDSCYQTEKTLTCTIVESEGHTHDDACKNIEQQLICGQEESEEGHVHEASCYMENVTYICGQAEVAGHTHEEACFTETKELICEMEVTTENTHQHTEDCYEKKQTCEKEEHEHEKICFSNPDADVETPSVWERTFANVKLTGDWSKDFIAIAETQLGYHESEENYTIDDEGRQKGYTRYGAWYGDPYGDWCAMYVSFCLNYANIPKDIMPQEANCQRWIEKLSSENYDLYVEEADFIPMSGDLVFFNTNDTKEADHIGIVVEYIEATNTEPAKIKTIEGNSSNQVEYNTYNINNKTIMGYGILPEEAQEEEEPVVYATNNPANGDKYHASNYLYYQIAGHKLDGGELCTFVLVPSSEYSNRWKPNMTNWSANAGANYVVAYCCDSQTYSSSSGENYRTYTLDLSRFTNAEQRATLKGIIANAYPFLTLSEMRAELKEAYQNGEIAYDVSDCVESDLMTAVQWAIWDTTNVSGTFSTVSGSSIPNWGSTLNPLTNPGHGSSDKNLQRHIQAIRDWLVAQRMPDKLAMKEYDSSITVNDNGTYDLTVTVTLNRAVHELEEIETKLVAGRKSSNSLDLAVGTEEFTLSVENLTAQEVTQAKVNIGLKGQGIQTYFYDSENYQDLIGGVWETYTDDLSFEVAAETTSVSVTKRWTREAGASSVKIQLFADGEECGDKVTLNDSNSWTYTWDNLPLYNITNELIEYSIKEDPVPGYYSSVQKVEGTATTANMWKQVSEFESGGKYLIESRSGMLAWHTFKSYNALTWATVNVADVENTPSDAIWTASGSSGKIKLSNDGFTRNNRLVLSNSQFRFDETGSNIQYTDNKLSIKDGSTYYFSSINTDGFGVTTTNASSAATFNIYKLTEVELPASGINFLVTNAKAESSMSVSVEKAWAGRRDGAYPTSVQVTLLQDGKSYGAPIELNANNNWSYTWTDLPASVDGTAVNYAVKELSVNGYTTSITQSETGAGIKFTITNTWNPEYATMALQKVDADDHGTLLAGAQFELYHVVTAESGLLEGETLVDIPGTDGEQGVLAQNVSVDSNGSVTVSDLEIGETYYLVESVAPEGYNRLKTAIPFKVTKLNPGYDISVLAEEEWTAVTSGDIPVLSVENQVAYNLPKTGGVGTTGYTVMGILLICSGFCIIYKKEREKERK